VRLGAKLSAPTVLAFAFPGGIKYRDVESGKRWSAAGSEWSKLKVVRAGVEQSDTVIVAEGETDGARLTMLYSATSRCCLPARRASSPLRRAARGYARVLIGLDNDEAGEEGAAKLAALLPQALRFAPPGSTTGARWTPTMARRPARPARAAGRAGQRRGPHGPGAPRVASWFEGALLPVGGQMVLHGWAKSFKSYLSLDLGSALAQGQDWCGFEPTEEPARWPSCSSRFPPPTTASASRRCRPPRATEPAFDENFMTWTPLSRPQLRAGVKEQEEFVRRTLVRPTRCRSPSSTRCAA
jgi:hypothetical protein